MTETTTMTTGTPRASMLHITIALGAVYLIWGSTYLAIRFAIETIPPFLMAGTRYLTAGILIYGWSRLRGAPRPTLIQWRSALILGAFLLLVGNGAVVWAEQHVDSGLAALLISTEPLWIVILVWLRTGRKRPDWRVVAGLVMGFVGLMLLVRPGSGSVNALGAGALVLASLSWAWGSIYGQRAPLPSSPLATTGMQMLSGGALLFLTSASTGEFSHFAPAAVTAKSLLALGYLIVFGAIVAFTAYVWLLRVAPPVLVSTYAYVNPVVAVLLGWFFAGEPLTGKTALAAAVILTGVALISLAQSRRSGSEREQERKDLAAPARKPVTEPMPIEAEVCASR
ncbi:MAG TPA: drug/metabolite exporter YedA [Thermoanaerobaculia bacterium]|nr:drug/metabolite exporter YedA [Thermoanaerobaculia bacterium]